MLREEWPTEATAREQAGKGQKALDAQKWPSPGPRLTKGGRKAVCPVASPEDEARRARQVKGGRLGLTSRDWPADERPSPASGPSRPACRPGPLPVPQLLDEELARH